ncbi:MAG: hypothetical protein JXA66_01565 [Oligoflexia bacterium]|nr:hypothetical protein [Oligoflexia bacterium]
MKKRSGQATVEYLVLLVVIAVIFGKVIHHVQDIFYGWDEEKGAIELFIEYNVVQKLSNPASDQDGNPTGIGWR